MRRTLFMVLLVALVAGVRWSDGLAQFLPENHYKVYRVVPPATYAGPITLRDQFGTATVEIATLEKFATPVEKNGEPMFDLRSHQTWWRISVPFEGAVVGIDNQFGQQNLTVRNAVYLVLPAVKDQGGPPPIGNHYECYDASGPPVDMPVSLLDQFGLIDAVATVPVLFCNPAEKLVPGADFPIVHPEAHLTCYRLEPPKIYGITAMANDQFGMWPVTLEEHEMLCVPTIKMQVVPNETGSWGRIKSLYGSSS